MIDPNDIGSTASRTARIQAATTLGTIRDAILAAPVPPAAAVLATHVTNVLDLTQQFLDKWAAVQDNPTVNGINEVGAEFSVAITEFGAARTELTRLGLGC